MAVQVCHRELPLKTFGGLTTQGPTVRPPSAQAEDMETSLHRDLKTLYAGDGARLEVPVGNFRIDVVRDDRLVEIQHGSLAAIRDKIQQLVRQHRVLLVKPIILRKRLVVRAAKGGRVARRRLSPKRGKLLDLFDDLVYFTRVFPHSRLTLEVPLVDVEEWRYPGHGRRRRWRSNDHQVEDRKLLSVQSVHRLHTTSDLAGLIPCSLPRSFHTGHLATGLNIPRWVAQRIAYCLRQTGTTHQVGKEGNARLYEFSHRRAGD